jgi:hypothetical protein
MHPIHTRPVCFNCREVALIDRYACCKECGTNVLHLLKTVTLPKQKKTKAWNLMYKEINAKMEAEKDIHSKDYLSPYTQTAQTDKLFPPLHRGYSSGIMPDYKEWDIAVARVKQFMQLMGPDCSPRTIRDAMKYGTGRVNDRCVVEYLKRIGHYIKWKKIAPTTPLSPK